MTDDQNDPNEVPGGDYSVPIDEKMKENMNRIARVITQSLPEGWGFSLFLFEYGEAGSCTYISSADRLDVISMVKQWIAYQEMLRHRGGSKH